MSLDPVTLKELGCWAFLAISLYANRAQWKSKEVAARELLAMADKAIRYAARQGGSDVP